jgi:ribonuclease HI
MMYKWVQSHEGVEGNEKAEEKATAAALGKEEGVKAIAEKYRGLSLAKTQKRILDAKWAET